MPSPGEQPRASVVSLGRLLMLLLSALVILFLWFRYPPLREYRLYLSDARPDARIDWKAIRGDWIEADLARELPGERIVCSADYTGTPKVDRVCSLDLHALNGTPTMYVNFLFSKGRLFKVATAIPWWSHGPGWRELTARLGSPHATQSWWHSGVRLHGWKMQDESAIFYNRDRSFNPLEPNSIQWLSASACAPRACLN
jgi:hypothetical protein